MKTVITSMLIVLGSVVWAQQNNWTMPLQLAEGWLLNEISVDDIKFNVPPAFQLLYEDENLLEFQFEYKGKSQEILLERDENGVRSVRYTTRYQYKEALFQQLAEAGYKQVGHVQDNMYTTKRHISPSGRLFVTIEAHRYYDMLIMTKQPVENLVRTDTTQE